MEGVLVKDIPTQATHAGAAYGPLDLKQFIQAAEGAPPLQFEAALKNGRSLPQGLICTSDGLLTGIPAKETMGTYEIVVTAKNAAGSLTASFVFVIKPTFAESQEEGYINKLKAQVWEALEQHLPIPEIQDIYNRPISRAEIGYLLDKWGVLTIWDVFNLDPPEEKKLLNLEGTSPHYYIYDRGCYLIAVPKDLYSHERTIEDSLQTARVMMREVYKRGWTAELAGIAKMARAAWVEAQHLGDLYEKRLQIVNFDPSPDDLKIYSQEALIRPNTG